MPIAFVMIQAEPQKITAVGQSIANLPKVAEVYSVTGEFDLLVVLRTSEYDDLSNLVPEKLSQIDGILRTNTVLAFRQFSAEDIAVGWDIGVD